MAAAPEVAIPAEIGKQLAPHAPTILMIPLVILSVICVIVGIIVLAAAQSKLPGAMLMLLGALLGGGAFLVMYRAEGRAKAD